MLFEKKDEKEIECPKCHKKIKPLIKSNRTKTEFYGGRFTGKDNTHWLICPECKKVIGTKQ